MKMKSSDLLSIVGAEIDAALGYSQGELSQERQELLEYYHGELYGDEVEGRSQVVTREVLETVEWILPSLLRVFTASDDYVAFEPVNEDDEEQAEQETAYINYVFSKENPGFLILYSFFKDALLQRNGVVKHYWDEHEEVTREAYEGLTDDELAFLMMDGSLEVLEHESQEIAAQEGIIQLHNVVFHRRNTKGKVSVEPVPPEEFLVSRNLVSVSLRDRRTDFVCHRVRKKRSDLIEEGYPKKLVKKLAADDADSYEEERYIRRDLEQDVPENVAREWASEYVWVHECYIRIDYDGDGVAELRRVVKAGNELLENEEADSIPFSSLTPIINTHRWSGLAVADLVKDLQKIKSAIMRAVIDNFWQTNNQRLIVNEATDLESLLMSNRPGGIIQVEGDGDPRASVASLDVRALGSDGFALMEYLDGIRKDRTGVDDNVMGLDPDTLQNAAVGAVTQSLEQARQKIDLIARIFAETGVKDMFLAIHELVQKHQDKEKIVRLNGQWVPVKPSEWRTRESMTVNVGLGTGNKDQQAAHLNNILTQQKEALGMGLPIVTMNRLFTTYKKLVETAGYKNANDFWLDPDSEEAQQIQQQQQMEAQNQPQQPNPLAEVEQIKGQFLLQAKQMQMEFDNNAKQMKIQSDMQVEAARDAARREIEFFKAQMQAMDKEADRRSKEAIEAAKLEIQAFLEGLRVDMGQPGIGANLDGAE